MLLLLPLLALAAPAAAAELRLEIGGLDRARSVLAMSSDATGALATAGCRDDGDGGDAAADGIWTCQALEAAAGEARVALSTDGQLLSLGGVVVDAAGTRAQVKVDGGKAVVDTAGGLLSPREDAPPRPVVPLVLLRATGDWSSGTPVLQLAGPDGAAQASCRDDGTFPDAVRNDGELACAAPATGGPVQLTLAGKGGERTDLGRFPVQADALITAVAWTSGAAQAEVVPLDSWPWPAAGQVVTEPAPGPEPEPVAAPEPTGPNPQAPEPLIAREETAPRALGGAADQHGRGLVDALAVLAALGAGFGLAWVVAPRRQRLPAGVERVEAPPLFDGGPRMSDPVAVFRAAEPRAFLAELLRRTAARRPVLVVVPEDLALPPVEGVIFRGHSAEWEDVAAQVRGLVRSLRQSPAVVVLGRDTLVSPGAVADDPARLLAEALPAGVWLGIVVAPAAPTVGALVPWTAHHEDGWQVTAAGADAGTAAAEIG